MSFLILSPAGCVDLVANVNLCRTLTLPLPFPILNEIQVDHNQIQKQERLDEENGVLMTDTGRYIPPFDDVPAAAVLVR